MECNKPYKCNQKHVTGYIHVIKCGQDGSVRCLRRVRRRTLNDERVMIKECYVQKLQQLKIDSVYEEECGKHLKSMFVCIWCYRNTEKCVAHLDTISRTAEEYHYDTVLIQLQNYES